MCAATRMHPDELVIDAALVRRLISAQFPDWVGRPVTPVASTGTDNAMFRLGPDLAVRLPRVEWAAGDVRREKQWLPQLAPRLPLPIPAPLAVGRPAAGYPWEWSVLRWFDGVNPTAGAVAAPGALARDLAAFVNALRAVNPAGGPAAHRSAPLASRDGSTRAAIAQLAGAIDAEAATALWDKALRLPEYDGPPTWMHGDLTPGNLLLNRAGRLGAVIDFGLMGVGDPTADLIVAWNLLPAAARPAFRAALGADDAMWGRGRAWAFSIALVTIPYYRHTNPGLTANARHVVREVLADRSV
ncbi:aminoglycoside phosphotransferase (APT) family kinase protein [Kitasatospora sp. MAA19]|uniref:aminoglycoside phosphotransferase family protein n=1 Tax=Kitasatospora sp. MAA19 TaxID=3035090 RepID=UPI0024734040|nr:aminoglycoside phosphotransferase family protein [Kitasatospora sp. MAA19]MDH6704002.1 aminoglycoside phosphotransferase (APT) family kinase protein [Kitasatospora sp. MAA19]